MGPQSTSRLRNRRARRRTRRRTLRRAQLCRACLVALLLAACLQAVQFSAALAHAELVRSDPPDNATLSQSPTAIRLWFSEAIAPGFTSGRVLNVVGKPYPGVRAHADPTDNTLLVIELPELPAGVYSVAYTALSAADGHTTDGHIAFRVGTGAGAAGGTLSAAPAGPAVAWPDAVLHWLNFTAQAGLIGALAVAFVLLNRNAGGDIAPALGQGQRRVLLWGAACGLLALIVGGVAFYRQAWQLAQSMPGSEAAPVGPVARQLLVTTRTGQLWLGREIVLIVMAVDLAALSRLAGPIPRRTAWPAGIILGVLAAGLLAATALTGHAAALEPRTDLAVVIDWGHLAAASLWVGGLLALAVGLLPLLRQRRGTPRFAALAHAAWGPFGVMAALSVATLFATGLYNTGREVASPDALLTTLYGRTLIAKVFLVLVVGAAGLLNSMLLHPRVAAPLARLLHRPSGWRPVSLNRLPALVLTEVGFGLTVLLLTGVMTSTTPPHGPAFAPETAQHTGRVDIATADDLRVDLVAQPNLPGANTLTVQVTPAGDSPQILRVIFHFTYLGQNVGAATENATQVGPDLYQLSGSQLSLAGPWQIDVVIRRRGVEDSTAHFTWTVPQPSSPRRVILSDHSWEAPLSIAAAALALAVIALTEGVLLRRGRPAS